MAQGLRASPSADPGGRAMAPATAQHPYNELVGEIVALADRAKGWNSYDADMAIPKALLGAVDLANSFWRLSPREPIPSFGLSPDTAVVLHWVKPVGE